MSEETRLLLGVPMEKQNSLQIKIVSFFVIALPLALICYFYIYENINNRKAAEIDKNIMITKSSGLFVEHEVNEKMVDMVNMVTMPAFANFDAQQMQWTVNYYKPTKQNYFVADNQGNIVAYTHKLGESGLTNIKGSPCFREAVQGRVVISGQQKSAITDEYAVFLCAPIFDKSKKIVGVVGNILPISFFKNILDPITVGKKGYLSLVDGSGFYIYDKTVDNKKTLVPSICYRYDVGKDLSVVERPGSRSGKMNIYTKVRLKSLGWYLIAFQPSSDITTPVIATVTRNLLSLALLVLTILVLWRYKVSLEYRNQLIKNQNAEKLALVGELAAGMAHEIRNPLTTIKGFANLLKSKPKYADDMEILDLLSGSVDHIEGIVRETLLLSRPQKMEVRKVNLAAMAEETFGFMKNEALLREINLELAVGDTSLDVEGDELHLKQVVINIIRNSLEATTAGGYVKIKLEKTDRNTAKISIEDNGRGMAPEVVDKAGRPFFTTKPNGTGLGLSVCRRIIEEHKGSFNIESKPGQGTTVEISLPLAR